MTQTQRELLFKDICCRLPYGVKASTKVGGNIKISFIGEDIIIGEDGDSYDISFITPYLYPLSSMTEEQWMDTPYANLNNFTFDSFKCGCQTLAFETYEVDLNYVVEFINWCYKNHFDIYGLIPTGLAIDCTTLNIY